jgi:protoporphyrinogen oxidase
MDLYDTVIVGGGISGLYAAWLIHKNYPNHKFIVLEKENYLGGRIITYSDKNMCVEAGAARFNENHHQLIELIRELGLHKKMVKITSDAKFYPSDGTHDTDTIINMLANPLKTVLEILINSKFSITSLIVRVIIYSKLFSKSELINTNFVSIARKTLSETEVQHIIDAFGFYTELVDMNAYDCINLMEGGLNPNQQFYTLRGGLSQIINVLYKKLKPHILTNVEIISISHNKNHLLFITLYFCHTKTKYRSHNIFQTNL